MQRSTAALSRGISSSDAPCTSATMAAERLASGIVLPSPCPLPQAGEGSMVRLIPVVVGLERALLRHAEIGRLLVGELGQMHADLGKMELRHLLVEMLGQGIDLLLVLALLGEQLDLRQRLVGE